MIEPKDGEWWLGKWSGTNFNCAMQYSGKTKKWHDHGVEASETNHSFEPLYKMVKAGGMEDLGSDYERGMREAMKDIAKSCGKTFSVDIGYLDLPKLVDSLVNKEKPKPRTKVVYEKVTFKKVTDIFGILESGEWLYTSNNGYSHIDLYLAMSREPCTMIDREFYLKVEKEIDWVDELDEFLKGNNIHSSERISLIERDKFIEMCHLVASLTDKPE